MQAVILAHQESIGLRQLTVGGLVGQLPLTTQGALLTNIVGVFQSALLDVIVVCRPGQTAQLEKLLNSSKATIDATRIAFAEVPANSSLTECIYRLRDRISSVSHLFLTYGDLAVTNLDIRRLFLNMVRTNSGMVCLASPYHNQQKGDSGKTVKSQIQSPPHDLLVLDEAKEQLVMFLPAADAKRQIRVPKSITSTHTHLTTRSDLHDVGFYLFSSFALKLLEWIRDDTGIRKHFLRHLINVEQYKPFPFDTKSLFSDLPPELQLAEHEIPKFLKVSVVVHEDKAVCRRLDSPSSYLEAVKLIRENYPDTTGSETTTSKDALSPRTPVADCSVGEDCVFASGVLVRSCILGAHCKVGENSRIVSSVLLKDVIIKEGCKITNCLIGEGVEIEENCVLKDCTVAVYQHIPARAVIQNENLGFSEMDMDLV